MVNNKIIKNVIICGLGGIGCTCAAKIFDSKSADLKILIDKQRWERYKKEPTFFNSKQYNFDYILPDKTDYKADLIIIATKNDGLEAATENIKNFVDDKTIIISLLNGVNSEEKITEKYGEKNVLYSFYIGCSCIREGRKIVQNGDYNIVIGLKHNYQKDILLSLDNFLTVSDIKHYVSENIINEYWRKFIINVGVNQICAVTGKTLKEIKKNHEITEKLKKLMQEAASVAKAAGIKNYNALYNEAVHFLVEELEDANPSMLQDVNAKRKTEVDIFAGQVIKLGEKYNIETPENEKVYKLIKKLELN